MSQWPTEGEMNDIYVEKDSAAATNAAMAPRSSTGEVVPARAAGPDAVGPDRSLTLRQKKLRRKALRRVLAKLVLLLHVALYVGVNTLLWVIYALTPAGKTGIPWPIWATAGWGLGLVIHAIVTFVGLRSTGSVEREISRLER